MIVFLGYIWHFWGFKPH